MNPRINASIITSASLILMLYGTAVADGPSQASSPTTQVAAVSPAAPAAPDPRFHLDVEVDPLAYVLKGYSLHVALGWKRFRVDLGAFAMEVPGEIQGNKDFDVSFTGYGAKLQYFAFAEQHRGFVGVDANVGRQLLERVGTTMSSRDLRVSLGVNAGWRFMLGQRLYATTWIGVSYGTKTNDVNLAGATYTTSRINVFPAVHLGYRFR
jgi:hypothetical protein